MSVCNIKITATLQGIEKNYYNNRLMKMCLFPHDSAHVIYFYFRFDCMNKMDKKAVDLITLEAGQGYFAGRYHSMRPILAEKYDTGTACNNVNISCCPRDKSS